MPKNAAPRAPLTAERAHELLSYDPEMGEFRWRVRRGRSKAGSQAGSPHPQGYIRIRIDGVGYAAHRLAWFWMKGEWPQGEVDHRNRNRAVNRWRNLRLATRPENAANASLRIDNRSGFRGVSYCKAGGRWMAYVRKAGKQRYLGLFDTPEVAGAVAQAARQAAFGAFAST
jgi:hypothetical protein